MRVAFLGAVAMVVVACSGAAPSILDEPHDGGTGSDGSSGSSSGGGSGGGSGGSSSGSSSGSDAMPMGDDQSDATTLPPQDAAVQETAPACTVSPPGAAGACNSITAPASTITVECDTTGTVPAPLGGTIHDGNYKLISATYYTNGGACPTPETDGVSWDICGTSWQISQNDLVNGATQPPLVANATVVTTGSSLAITITCGLTTAPITFAYDADATTLRLHTGGTATTGRVDTFARQ
jgi:hypothetical protein